MTKTIKSNKNQHKSVTDSSSSEWKRVKLGEFVQAVKGKKPKVVSKIKSKQHPIPYINIKAFEKNIIDEYTDGVGCVVCEDDDFLMVWDGSRSGYVGKAIKGALGSTLMKLNFPNIDNNFAYYFLQSKFFDLNTRAKGVGIPHVDPSILWNYDLLIPPMEIQKAIVSKIEELFSELDKGIESLKLAQQQLKVYRQSVLKWAFEGRLTNGDVKEGELPEGWKLRKLKDITKTITDGDHQAPPKSTTGIPFITISNVDKSTNKIDFSDTFLVGSDYYSNITPHRKPIKGDILYTVTGSFGIPILIDFDKQFCFQRHIGLIRPLNTINQKWLYYLLLSPSVYNQAIVTATGTAQKTVSLNSLRNFEVLDCSYEQQTLTVQAIESRLSLVEKMEESINQSLQQSEALRQSILKRAFEGNLT